jgi:hypothetical protein
MHIRDQPKAELIDEEPEASLLVADVDIYEVKPEEPPASVRRVTRAIVP